MGLESLPGWIPALLLGVGVVVALLVAVAALAATRRLRTRLRAAGQLPAGGPERARRDFANLLLRYSEQLGVELVTGRIPHPDEGSIALRVQLERALVRVREPGAVELVDEVGDARTALVDLDPRRRAAANGLAAMEVEWSIDRWTTEPRSWLADLRERERLTRIADAGPLAAAS